MNIAESNLFRIHLSMIRAKADELNELTLDDTIENLSAIKNSIEICENLLGEEL